MLEFVTSDVASTLVLNNAGSFKGLNVLVTGMGFFGFHEAFVKTQGTRHPSDNNSVFLVHPKSLTMRTVSYASGA